MENGKGYVDGFFRWVWRINGLLLLTLVLYGAINIIGLFAIKSHGQAPDGTATIGRLDQPDRHQAALKLSSFEALQGTPVLYARLGSEGAPVGSLSSGFTPTDVHNLLFFDATSRQAHWLFDDNAQTITAMSVISESAPTQQAQGAKPDCQALGLLFLTRSAKADNQSNASWDIRLASVDGRQLKTIATGVDTLLGHQLTDNHTLLVFYAAQGVAHVLDVDPATRETRSGKPLAAHN
jgi:hypothetical protein